jgi:hypothetical protein
MAEAYRLWKPPVSAVVDSGAMPFVPYGKKAKAKRAREGGQAARELAIDRALGQVRRAVGGQQGLCLPMCVLAERILAQGVPPPRFALRLGSLHVYPEDEDFDPIAFDPRTPEGIDAGFHAWLFDGQRILDPSIHLTLALKGYPVDPAGYVLSGGNRFALEGLRYLYEELPDLEMFGLEASEPHLNALMAFALGGELPLPGTLFLDVRWRASV